LVLNTNFHVNSDAKFEINDLTRNNFELPI